MTADARTVARDLMKRAEECASQGDHRGAALLYQTAAEFALGDRNNQL